VCHPLIAKMRSFIFEVWAWISSSDMSSQACFVAPQRLLSELPEPRMLAMHCLRTHQSGSIRFKSRECGRCGSDFMSSLDWACFTSLLWCEGVTSYATVVALLFNNLLDLALWDIANTCCDVLERCPAVGVNLSKDCTLCACQNCSWMSSTWQRVSSIFHLI